MQTNRLLLRGKHYYPKAIGVKTGYTSASQNTLVAAAKSEDRTLIAVLLKVKERPEISNEAIKLFDAAFSEGKVTDVILPEGPQTITLTLEGAKKPIKTYTKESLALTYYPAEEPSYKSVLIWDPAVLPINKDQPIGKLLLQDSSRGCVAAGHPLLPGLCERQLVALVFILLVVINSGR